MRVVVISESEFSVKGHGVHTAYLETVNALSKQPEIEVLTNTFKGAEVRHIHTVGPYALAQLLFGNGKKIVSAHVLPESFVGSLIGAQYWLGFARWYLRWFYSRAARVIAVSDETRDGLTKLGVTSPIDVLYNMIDTSRYARSSADRGKTRQQFDIDEKDFVVVGNGQVQPRKRVDSFIRAARALPDCRFIWIGGIPFKRAAADYEAMNRLIEQAPANFTATGVVSLDEVKRYFHAADMFFLPSEQETFGLAVVEAAAAGLPVMIRDIDDYKHTFADYAVMASEGTFVEWIRKLQHQEKLYEEYVQKAHQLAKRFDSQSSVQQLIQLYRR